MRTSRTVGLVVALLGLTFPVLADDALPLAPGVRGLVTKAPAAIVIDGSLREWSDAFCTPVNYAQRNLENRAGQFFYLWDDEAFYVGVRCLDKKQANPGPMQATYDGDAVEFYLDTRHGDALRGKDWTTGAIHLHFSAFQGAEVKPRWVVRGGIATSNTVLKGVEIAAKKTADLYELEFKLPWANFPEFTPKLGAVMALDAELCSGDGGKRLDRTFAYGSPLSVQQPASQAKVELVKAFEPEYLPMAGPAAFPLWEETPWVQPERTQVLAVVAIPPAFTELVGQVDFRVHDTDGKIVKTIPGKLEHFGPSEAKFTRALARWSIDDFAPNTYFVTARISTRTEKVLTTVAPRMVHEAIISGR